jgi:VanZ family protein
LARLLLLTIVLIAYGSLYPWHLRPVPSGQNPVSIVFHSWPSPMDAGSVRDIAVNVLVYLPLGLFAFSTLAEFWRPRVAALASLLVGFVLSTFVELSQVFIVGRVPSLLDITSDTAGTAIGIVAGALWNRGRHRRVPRPDWDFLLCLWVLAQTFPFVPRLRPNVTLRSPLEDVLLFFAEAASLVPLIRSLGATEHRNRIFLAALLLLVPLKAFIYTRGVTLAEIVCSAIVFAIAWFVPLRAVVVAPVLAFAVVVHGLAPFHFLAAPHAFFWVPFQASLYLEWEPALTIMLGKVFVYGALLWLIRESGVRLAAATALTAVLLAGIEAIQMYLPGRSSEIVDPLIAVILGWVFWSLGNPRSSYARRATFSL